MVESASQPRQFISSTYFHALAQLAFRKVLGGTDKRPYRLGDSPRQQYCQTQSQEAGKNHRQNNRANRTLGVGIQAGGSFIAACLKRLDQV